MLYTSDDQMTTNFFILHNTPEPGSYTNIIIFCQNAGRTYNIQFKNMCYNMAFSSHLHIPTAQSLDRRQGVARTSLTNFLLLPVIQPQSLVILPAVE